MLILDGTKDRKDGCTTDHVPRQYQGSVGNGLVAVTTLWADEQHHLPLYVMTHTPQNRLANDQQDPARFTPSRKLR